MATRRFDVVPSTQELALALARSGSEPGTTMVAKRQERGVGRASHTWASPEGGLYLSTILNAPREAATLFPLSACARIGAAMRERYSVETLLKWPNDLLVPRSAGAPQKLAGLLVDRVDAPSGAPLLVAGIGINVASSRSAFPSEVEPSVAILSELAAPAPSLDEVETLVLREFDQAREELSEPGGVGRSFRRCRAALYGKGRRARVDGAPVGTILDLSDDGALWIDGPAGPVPVYAGHLELEDP